MSGPKPDIATSQTELAATVFTQDEGYPYLWDFLFQVPQNLLTDFPTLLLTPHLVTKFGRAFLFGDV